MKLPTATWSFVAALGVATGGTGQEPAARASCTLTIGSTSQFVPLEWSIEVSHAAGAAGPVTLGRRPRLDVERVSGQGERRSSGNWPTGRGLGAHPPATSAVVWQPLYWAGVVPLRLRGVIEDWRCLGFPGRYRARAVWTELTPPAERGAGFRSHHSDWQVFSVEPAREDGSGAELAASQAASGALWKAYQAFMDRELRFAPLAGEGGGRDAHVYLEILRREGNHPDGTEVLEAASIPDEVRWRVDLFRTLNSLGVGRWQGADGAPLVREALDRANGLAAGARGCYLAVAKLVRCGCLRHVGDSTGFLAARAALRDDAAAWELVVGDERLARALWDDTLRRRQTDEMRLGEILWQ